MLKSDVTAARNIFSLAFGTFLGVAEARAFAADIDYIGTRRQADPTAAFVAEFDGEVIGSNIASRWGSVGLVGPLTIRPDMWGKGFARELMVPISGCLQQWQVTLAGLCTFPHSTKHAHLYQQFGFWPRFLIANMSRPVREAGALHQQSGQQSGEWSGFSSVSPAQQAGVLDECYQLTDSIYPGLRLDREIRAVAGQGLGETVLIREAGELSGFAVCQCGVDTEAGAGKCYIKFAAVRPGVNAENRFEILLAACEQLALDRGAGQLMGGISMARHEAYVAMLGLGFRTLTHSVAMHRPNEAGYSTPGTWLIDDWR